MLIDAEQMVKTEMKHRLERLPRPDEDGRRTTHVRRRRFRRS